MVEEEKEDDEDGNAEKMNEEDEKEGSQRMTGKWNRKKRMRKERRQDYMTMKST